MVMRIIGALFMLCIMWAVTFGVMFVYPRNPNMLKEMTVSSVLTGSGSVLIAVGFLLYGHPVAPYIVAAGLLDYSAGFIIFIMRRLRSR